MIRNFIIVVLLFLISDLYAQIFVVQKDLSNKDEGVENFQYLYELHKKAQLAGGKVLYPNKQNIYLTIKENSQSIILCDTTDFNNCTIYVSNHDVSRSHFYLFSLLAKDYRHGISINADLIDNGDFSSIPELSQGTKILCVKDENLWSDRIGYNDPCYRQDILLLHDGKAENSVISPYNNTNSKPTCWYVGATANVKIFQNLNFVREEMLADGKTLLLKCLNTNNIAIKSISVATPEDENAYEDFCFNIEDCINLTMENVQIDGTYSQLDKYGYGIALRNVCNAHFSNIEASAKWGIFGNYFVNTASLDNCIINRFDVHCYGKDITINNCTFKADADYDPDSHNVYNQFSSMYGNIIFKNCLFEQGIPFLVEPSFKFNSDFTLYFTDCTFNIGKHKFLIDSPQLLPNVHVDNLQLNNDKKGFKTFK